MNICLRRAPIKLEWVSLGISGKNIEIKVLGKLSLYTKKKQQRDEFGTEDNCVTRRELQKSLSRHTKRYNLNKASEKKGTQGNGRSHLISSKVNRSNHFHNDTERFTKSTQNLRGREKNLTTCRQNTTSQSVFFRAGTAQFRQRHR